MAVENLGGCALSKHAAPRVEERGRRALGERRGRTDAMPGAFHSERARIWGGALYTQPQCPRGLSRAVFPRK